MMGLRQKILAASSEEEVSKLLAEGKTYEFASKETRNSWKTAAERRLKGAKYVPKSNDAEELPEKKRKHKKKK